MITIKADRLQDGLYNIKDGKIFKYKAKGGTVRTYDMGEVVICEDCRYRNTWDNPRLDPQYYRCRNGVKFRDYGYVREDDYCPLGKS